MSIYHGDCIEVMRAMPDASVDSIVTDPPYGLGFMGKQWDALPPGEEWARECLRVLKPGGYLLAFGGTRTWHRLAVAVEDAGFEIRDSIAWMHGQGFPKGKAGLKPAHEPIVVARKKPDAPRTGLLQIDACRVGVWSDFDKRNMAVSTRGNASEGWGFKGAGTPLDMPTAGRWPANVVLDESQAEALDQMSGVSASNAHDRGKHGGMLRLDGCSTVEELRELAEQGSRTPYGRDAATTLARYEDRPGSVRGHVDIGGASRFFYVAKASRRERPTYIAEGVAADTYGTRKRCTVCGKQEVNMPGSMCVCPEPDFQADPSQQNKVSHPTVKPLALMRWLVRLVTPPGGTVLDPFAGSGTTIEAALLEGLQPIGIEREADYLPLIEARIERASEQLGLFGGDAA